MWTRECVTECVRVSVRVCLDESVGTIAGVCVCARAGGKEEGAPAGPQAFAQISRCHSP